MSVTARLVYDPAADSSSHKVGSYVLAGDDGTQIGHVSDALKVSFTNASLAVTATDLDIRDLAFATDKVDVSGSSNVGVTATDFDIRDLSHSQDSVKIGDGTDFLAINNDGSINAVISGYVDVDDSLANTAIFTEARAVSTTAITITAAAALASRKWLYMANMGNKAVFVGPSGVTATDGFPCFPGQQSEFRIGAAVAPYIIGETGASSEDIRVMQLS
jgi:hypothetical protein